MTESAFRSGFVTLIGRPNAGKSTLLNALVGSKVAITSNTPQTTRHRIRGIVDRDDFQIVLVDTPGLHKPKDALGHTLNRTALRTLGDVDVACFVVDASAPIGAGDAWVAEHIAKAGVPNVLVLTKADASDADKVAQQIERAQELMTFREVVVLSAKKGFNLEGFVYAVAGLLPEGPRYFPQGTESDQTTEMLVGEYIREKVLRATFDEVPHSVGVLVDAVEDQGNRALTRIHATIVVERDSQKGIIIGKGGEALKAMGIAARRDLERLLGNQVHLELVVKARPGWRSDDRDVRLFGYGDGE